MSTYMIENPRAYFRQWVPPRDALLLDLEEEARKEEIPIIGPVVGRLLYILARVTGARRILELGTATGYSTLWLARGCTGGEIVTIEHSPALAERARANFRRAGMAERITVREGDAIGTMSAMTGPFDLIFMDIDKEYYPKALEPCCRLLKQNGLLIADNTAFKDADEFNRAIDRHA